MKRDYLAVFILMVSLLILLFAIWDVGHSKFVIISGGVLIIVVSVIEIFYGVRLVDMPHDSESL